MAITITASSSSPTLLNLFQSSKDFFMNSHALISTKSISSSPKPETQIEICSKKVVGTAQSRKWKTRVSFCPGFLNKGRDVWSLKDELFEAIAPLDRGAEATPQDHERIDQIARKLEEVREIKQPLKSNLLNGKWELLYTTSEQTLQAQRPKFLRPNGKIYQAINLDTLRAQNIETWPFFNQATANLVPLNATKVAVTFDFFKIGGVIQIKSPVVGRGELEITYLDQELRISRGNLGNLFILKMVDPSYRVPL